MVQFNEDLEEEPKAKTPFWRKWKFYRTAFLFVTRCELSTVQCSFLDCP